MCVCVCDVAPQEVPDPLKYFVTRWNKDPWSQMSYSFVKTGGSGEAYDIIAEDVQGKIYFAGEVRNFQPDKEMRSTIIALELRSVTALGRESIAKRAGAFAFAAMTTSHGDRI